MKKFREVLSRHVVNKLVQIGLTGLLVACGNWVGNPKEKVEDQEGTSAGQLATAGKGDMLLHRVSVKAGEPTAIQYNIQSGAGLALTAAEKQDFEVSLIDASGEERIYSRETAGDTSISFTPDVDGDYTVLIKNNSGIAADVAIQETSGLATDDGVRNATVEGTGVYKDVVFKAVVTFARNCKSYADGGNSVAVREAPAGSYFIQPFVFLGKVDGETKEVSPLSTASISIVSGDTVLELKKLSDFDLGVFREFGGLSKDQHVSYTRSFYSGYFGAAGEMYTTDTFRFGGDCAAAPVFALPKDVGLATIELKINDPTLEPALDARYPIRPTASAAFTMYEKEGKKLDNWDPCSYDAFTAIPYNYNDASLPCRQLSVLDAPFITLDYKLPSGYEMEGYSKASDPTRVLYYGYSLSKSYKKAVIDQQDKLRAGQTSIALDACLNNGGIHAVPLDSEKKTYLPLGEFNARSGDLIQLARKTGSYTALTDFYQGNVSKNGTVDYASCIPNSAAHTSCDDFKIIQVNISNCTIKADSGISASSIGDNFIYPEYFEMSGEIVD